MKKILLTLTTCLILLLASATLISFVSVDTSYEASYTVCSHNKSKPSDS